MAGRKPLPTALKLLRGNPGKRPLNRGEAKPTPDTGNVSRWLDAMAKEEWRRVVAELRCAGLLTVVDRAALEAYCQTYARWRWAEDVLRAKGHVYLTATGFLKDRPEVGIAERSLKLMKAFMVEFGMTPSSRSRISLPPPDKEEDPFETYLRTEGIAEPEVADGE